MLSAFKSELGRFASDEGGFLEGDWFLVVAILGGALSLSSYLGYNIGHIVSQAFDDLIMSALRRAGA
jgi:hypothetical protein